MRAPDRVSGSVRLYVACSIDGFIADRDGGVDWLEPYSPEAYGYSDFMTSVGAVVIGRRTFEQILTFGEVWPYRGKRTIIAASQAPKRLPPDTEAVVGGIARAIAVARAATARDIWIVGGAVTMRSALDAGLVDLAEIFVVPVLLGSGLALLGHLNRPRTLELDGIETFPDGVVKLRYLASAGRPTTASQGAGSARGER